MADCTSWTSSICTTGIFIAGSSSPAKSSNLAVAFVIVEMDDDDDGDDADNLDYFPSQGRGSTHATVSDEQVSPSSLH